METNYQDYSELIQKNTDRLIQNFEELRRAYFLNIVGDIKENPKSWPETKIEDEFAVKIETGKHLRKQDFNPYGEYPVYGGNGKIGVHSEASFEKNKIIIGRVGTLAGNVLVNNKRAWVTNNAMVMHVEEQQYLVEYLAQMLRMMNLNRLATGAAQPHISISMLGRQKILKPPIEVQKKLELYLSKINILEKKNRTRKDLLKNLVTQID